MIRLLSQDQAGNLIFEEHEGSCPDYAILSHTWAADKEQEVTFADIKAGSGQEKTGYAKVRFCIRKAAELGLQYSWVDSCCINRDSSAELQSAITSMYRWYRDARICLVYLQDVSIPDPGDAENDRIIESALESSRWFKRGWTLQELIAPSEIEFYSSEEQRLGDRSSLRSIISRVTGIPQRALDGPDSIECFDHETKSSWMRGRETKLEEDTAYALIGLLDISMYISYGEGRTKACQRLLGACPKPKKRRLSGWLSTQRRLMPAAMSEDDNDEQDWDHEGEAVEADWRAMMQRRRDSGACLNCGEHSHWANACRSRCGRCLSSNVSGLCVCHADCIYPGLYLGHQVKDCRFKVRCFNCKHLPP